LVLSLDLFENPPNERRWLMSHPIADGDAGWRLMLRRRPSGARNEGVSPVADAVVADWAALMPLQQPALVDLVKAGHTRALGTTMPLADREVRAVDPKLAAPPYNRYLNHRSCRHQNTLEHPLGAIVLTPRCEFAMEF
jgi:hypothetical protein